MQNASALTEFETHERLGTIDSWRNILSNKISALFRFEPKDVADIWILSKKKAFEWNIILDEAKTKEAGVDPEIIYNRAVPKIQITSTK